MEILERGTPPGKREFQGRCNNCDTLVKFKQSEGQVTYDQRDGNYVSVTCPVCGCGIHVGL